MHIMIRGVEITPDNWREVLTPDEDNKFTKEEISDLLGALNEERKFAAKVENFIKETIRQYFESDEFEFSTDHFMIIRTSGVWVGLDNDKVKTEMGEDWYNEHLKRSEYFKVDVKRIG